MNKFGMLIIIFMLVSTLPVSSSNLALQDDTYTIHVGETYEFFVQAYGRSTFKIDLQPNKVYFAIINVDLLGSGQIRIRIYATIPTPSYFYDKKPGMSRSDLLSVTYGSDGNYYHLINTFHESTYGEDGYYLEAYSYQPKAKVKITIVELNDKNLGTIDGNKTFNWLMLDEAYGFFRFNLSNGAYNLKISQSIENVYAPTVGYAKLRVSMDCSIKKIKPFSVYINGYLVGTDTIYPTTGSTAFTLEIPQDGLMAISTENLIEIRINLAEDEWVNITQTELIATDIYSSSYYGANNTVVQLNSTRTKAYHKINLSLPSNDVKYMIVDPFYFIENSFTLTGNSDTNMDIIINDNELYLVVIPRMKAKISINITITPYNYNIIDDEGDYDIEFSKYINDSFVYLNLPENIIWNITYSVLSGDNWTISIDDALDGTHYDTLTKDTGNVSKDFDFVLYVKKTYKAAFAHIGRKCHVFYYFYSRETNNFSTNDISDTLNGIIHGGVLKLSANRLTNYTETFKIRLSVKRYADPTIFNKNDSFTLSIHNNTIGGIVALKLTNKVALYEMSIKVNWGAVSYMWISNDYDTKNIYEDLISIVTSSFPDDTNAFLLSSETVNTNKTYYFATVAEVDDLILFYFGYNQSFNVTIKNVDPYANVSDLKAIRALQIAEIELPDDAIQVDIESNLTNAVIVIATSNGTSAIETNYILLNGISSTVKVRYPGKAYLIVSFSVYDPDAKIIIKSVSSSKQYVSKYMYNSIFAWLPLGVGIGIFVFVIVYVILKKKNLNLPGLSQ